MTDGVQRTVLTRTAWLVATLVIVFAFTVDLLVPGNNLFARDIARIYVPERAALAAAMRDGGLPGWNPLAAGGQPLAANPGYEAFYPPQWSVLFLSPAKAFNLEIVAHLLLAAAGMFALLTSLGTLPVAAAFGAVSYALGGTMLSASNLAPFLFSLAWFPWIVLFGRRFLAHRRLRDFSLVSLALGMVLLIGDQSMILQAGAILLACWIEEIWQRRGNSVRLVALLAAVVVTACLVGSVQIAPALDLQPDSGRARGLERAEAMTWSMPPYRPLEIIFPAAFSSIDPAGNLYFWARHRFDRTMTLPWIFSFYPGMLAGILVVAGFLCRCDGWRSTAVVSSIAFLLALGTRGGVFPLLYEVGFRSIRYPEKFFLSAIFVLTLFAAMTADAALRDQNVRRTLVRVSVVIAAVYAILLAAAMLPVSGSLFARFWGLEPAASTLIMVFRSAWAKDTVLAALLCFLLLSPRLRPALRVLLLFAVVVVDLASRALALMPRIEPHYYDDPPAATWMQRESPPTRLFNHADWARYGLRQPDVAPELRQWVIRNGLLPSTPQLRGIPSILENDITRMNLRPSNEFAQAFWKISARRPDQAVTLLEMAGVTHIATLREIPAAVRFDPVLFESVAPVAIQRTGLRGRYYFASRLRPHVDSNAFAAALLNEPVRPPGETFTDITPFQPASGRIVRLTERPSQVLMEVEAAGRAVLVIAISQHRYWTATVDGQPTALHPANVAFQALEVPRGRHHVTLQYRNPLLPIFAVVSVVTVALLLMACLCRTSYWGSRIWYKRSTDADYPKP